MKRTVTAAALLFALACTGDRTDGSGYVGLMYPPLPEGLASAGALAFPDGPFALDLVFAPERQMVWLSRGAGMTREVVAVLDVPRTEQNVQLVYMPGACRIGAVPDPEVIALARFTFAPVLEDVVLAWRADRAAGRFVPLDTAVSCRNQRVPE